MIRCARTRLVFSTTIEYRTITHRDRRTSRLDIGILLCCMSRRPACGYFAFSRNSVFNLPKGRRLGTSNDEQARLNRPRRRQTRIFAAITIYWHILKARCGDGIAVLASDSSISLKRRPGKEQSEERSECIARGWRCQRYMRTRGLGSPGLARMVPGEVPGLNFRLHVC